MEATTPTAKSKRRLRRKRRELDALVVGATANSRPSRRGTRSSSSSDSSSCGGDDPEAGLCPPRASSSSSGGGGCRRRDEARRRCGRRHSRCPGGRGAKGSGRRCLSSRPRGTLLPLAVRGAGACMAIACLLGAATALAWLFLDARHQTDSLRVHLDAVVAGSKGVPDALQKCHSMSKELQHNQTILMAQLVTLSSQVANFSIQVKQVHSGLSDVNERIKATPELVTVPQELLQLSQSVGQLGSSVEGLDVSVKNLKASNIILRNETDILNLEVANLKETLLQLSNASANGGSTNMEGGGSADIKSEDDLEKLLTTLRQEVVELKANMSRISDALTQKILADEKDSAHQGEMSGMLLNVTGRVATLENSFSKDFSELSTTIDQITVQFNDTLHQIESQVAQLAGRMNEKPKINISSERDSVLTSTSKPVNEVSTSNKSMVSIIPEKTSSISTEKTQNMTIAPQISADVSSSTEGKSKDTEADKKTE